MKMIKKNFKLRGQLQGQKEVHGLYLPEFNPKHKEKTQC